jgi:hypothetical protein
MTQQTIDKLRDALDEMEHHFQHGNYPTNSHEHTVFMIAQAALKFIDTEGGWMPIESAPKDGTEFLSFTPSARKRKTHVTHWCDFGSINGGRWEDSRCQWINPTHWMSLNPADRLLQMIEGGE